MRSIIVYGPQGCGKTRHAELLRDFFGMSHIVDDWDCSDPIPDDALVLTVHRPPDAPGTIAFEQAVAAALAASQS